MRVTTSAPGKVVILGEYAVLEGAPALVMAVDRRATVRLETHSRPDWSVSAPGWAEGQARFRIRTGGQSWPEGTGRFSLARHVIEDFFAWHDSAPGAWLPFDLVLDSRPLSEAGARKIGLGSSAALTVALCGALGYYAATQHEVPVMPELSTLIDIHAGLQGGRGSGLDVAASLHGGLVEYRRQPSPRACPSALPVDLDYCFVWTGRPAATGDFLALIERWRRDNEGQYLGAIGPLIELAGAGVRAAGGNDSDDFLRLLDEYTTALESLGDASGTDILSRPHRRLRDLGRRHGVVYKPCGAGGGDIGIGVCRDPEAMAAFRDALEAEGFQTLSLSIDRAGVQGRSEN